MNSLQPASRARGGPPFAPHAKARYCSGAGCAATGWPRRRSHTVARRRSCAAAAADQTISAAVAVRSVPAVLPAIVVSMQPYVFAYGLAIVPGGTIRAKQRMSRRSGHRFADKDMRQYMNPTHRRRRGNQVICKREIFSALLMVALMAAVRAQTPDPADIADGM